MATDYRHEPLDLTKAQIRLFEIDFTHKEGVRGSLHKFNINDELPAFQALSYMWGEPEPKMPVEIDGQKLWIRPDLYDFLRVQDRLPDLHSQYIWIDQICIDQTSMLEKNQQVPMMGSIFGMASCVLVWLGYLDNREELVLLFRRLGQLLTVETPLLTSAELSTVRQLLGVRYWIIQELLMARACTIVYSEDVVPFDIVLQAWRSYYFSPPEQNEHPTHALAICSLKDVWSTTSKQRQEPIPDELLTALFAISTVCESAKDKVYGLQSVLSKKFRVDVDYRKSVEDIFLDMAELLVGNVYWNLTVGNLACSMGLIDRKQKILLGYLLAPSEAARKSPTALEDLGGREGIRNFLHQSMACSPDQT